MIKLRKGDHIKTLGMSETDYKYVVCIMSEQGFDPIHAYPIRNGFGPRSGCSDHLMIDNHGNIDAGTMIDHLPEDGRLLTLDDFKETHSNSKMSSDLLKRWFLVLNRLLKIKI